MIRSTKAVKVIIFFVDVEQQCAHLFGWVKITHFLGIPSFTKMTLIFKSAQKKTIGVLMPDFGFSNRESWVRSPCQNSSRLH